jgi:ornithine cyclodeaminase/alanine dehydrogenase
MPLRFLSEADLERLALTTQDVIASIEGLIQGLAAGTVWSAPKAVMLPPDGRYMMAALAAADDPPLLAVKTVILNPKNSERGIPLINGVVTMLDSGTGLPVAVIDGNWVTAVRTAGLSATAAKAMARPDSSIAAFIGSGVQARSHLRAFADLFPLKEIRISGRGRANIERLSDAAQKLGLAAEVADSPVAAMRGADLVVTTLTRAPGRPPFLDAGELKPGAFAAVVDLAEPWKQDTFDVFDRIVIDDLEQEAATATKLAPPHLVTGDLAGLVQGRVKGRTSPEERTAFIFRGYGIGDLALAGLAYQKAAAAGIGKLIDG